MIKGSVEFLGGVDFILSVPKCNVGTVRRLSCSRGANFGFCEFGVSISQDITGCSSSSEAVAEFCTIAWTVSGVHRLAQSACILRVQAVEISTSDD